MHAHVCTHMSTARIRHRVLGRDMQTRSNTNDRHYRTASIIHYQTLIRSHVFCTNFLSYLKQTRNLAISLFYKFRLKTTFSHYVTESHLLCSLLRKVLLAGISEVQMSPVPSICSTDIFGTPTMCWAPGCNSKQVPEFVMKHVWSSVQGRQL